MKKRIIQLLIVILLFNAPVFAKGINNTMNYQLVVMNKSIDIGDIRKNPLLIKNVYKYIKKQPLVNYTMVWLLFSDGCLHLGRLNDPGYIDENGVCHNGFSITMMGWQNYVGTTIQCPPTGQYYC